MTWPHLLYRFFFSTPDIDSNRLEEEESILAMNEELKLEKRGKEAIGKQSSHTWNCRAEGN